MGKNIFRKKLVIGIIILFLGASVLPSIGGNLLKTTLKNDELTNEVCDWPMFHHYPNHTGYTDGKGTITGPCLKWSYKHDHWLESSPAIGDLEDGDPQLEVVYGGIDGNVYARDGITGFNEWNPFETGAWVTSSPAIAYGDIYVGSHNSYVYCIDGETGNEVWNKQTGGGIKYSSPAVVDGKVYIGSVDCKVYCLNAFNGSEIWTYETGDIIKSSPAVVDGKVYIGSNDSNLYCLNAVNGSFIWNYTTEGSVRSSPAVDDVIKGGSLEVVFASLDHKVYCLNAYDGSEIWIFDEIDGKVFSSPAIGNLDGDPHLEVVIGSGDNDNEDTCVYCIEEDGTLKWKFDGGMNFKSSPALGDIDNDGDNEIVIGCFSGQLYVLSNEGENNEWPVPFKTDGLSNWIDTSPALGDIDNDDVVEVVVGTGNIGISGNYGHIYAFDEDNIPPECDIRRPLKGWLYRNDKPIAEIGVTIILGDKFTIWVYVEDEPGKVPDCIDRLDFYYRDDPLVSIPADQAWDEHLQLFTWEWKDPKRYPVGLSVEVFDNSGNPSQDVFVFNPRSRDLFQNELPNFPELFKNLPNIFPIIRLLLQRFGL